MFITITLALEEQSQTKSTTKIESPKPLSIDREWKTRAYKKGKQYHIQLKPRKYKYGASRKSKGDHYMKSDNYFKDTSSQEEFHYQVPAESDHIGSSSNYKEIQNPYDGTSSGKSFAEAEEDDAIAQGTEHHKETKKEHKEKIKVKHHHHHHHHNHIKTVVKKVPEPYPVEKIVHVPVEKIIEKIIHIPKPYPVEKIVEKKIHVEKKVPYEVRVPYPVEKIVHVPQPYPVEKIVEKIVHVPKPYPVIKTIHVPVEVKVHVPKPYPVEKKVPYPVEVKVEVEKKVPYPVPYKVEIEKKVPYPVKIYIPHPYPVETKSHHYDKDPKINSFQFDNFGKDSHAFGSSTNHQYSHQFQHQQIQPYQQQTQQETLTTSNRYPNHRESYSSNYPKEQVVEESRPKENIQQLDAQQQSTTIQLAAVAAPPSFIPHPEAFQINVPDIMPRAEALTAPENQLPMNYQSYPYPLLQYQQIQPFNDPIGFSVAY